MGEALGWLVSNIVELSLIAVLIVAVILLFIRGRNASALADEHAAGARQLQQRVDAIESAADALIVTGGGDRCVYANPASAALFAYSDASALFGKTWRALIAESDAGRMETLVIPTLKKTGRWVGSLRGKTGKGGVIPLDVSISSVRGGYMFVLRNRRAAADEGDGDPMRFESLVNGSSNALVLIGDDFRILEWNPEAEQQLGRNRDVVLKTDFLQLFTGELRDRVEEQLQSVLSTRERKSFEATPYFETEAVEGEEERVYLWHASYVPSDPGGHIACVGQDVTGIKQTEEEFSRQEHLYRMLANNSSDLVGVHDLEGTFTYVSPSCTTLIGYTQEELVGMDPYQLSSTEDWKGIQAAMASARTGRHVRTSLRIRNSTGVYTWFEMSVRPIYDNLGAIVQIQTSSRDISEQKAVEAQLSHQALHEPLTGLPNRSLFLDRLRHAMTLAKRSGGQMTVMFMDLDRFKIINDSMGHEAGDRLIQAVARRLMNVVREGDTVARLGGDEFGVLLEYGITEADAEVVAGRILDAIEPPFTF
ncbi:MAG: PAS domain S-box protein, partial [Gemmatimonadota bacterium]|nr:PAS domain S-box protein [Gemmatimonadota bacterium]